jgi:predicted nuclease of predicted toxin-antitoxin system
VKLKLDENLPEALVPALAALGHDVDNVRQEGLAGRDDPAVWQTAQETGRFLITQDLDFSDRRRFAPGTHHGLLLVRLREAGRLALTAQIVELFRREEVATWARCFVVLSEHKLRISRPLASPGA